MSRDPYKVHCKKLLLNSNSLLPVVLMVYDKTKYKSLFLENGPPPHPPPPKKNPFPQIPHPLRPEHLKLVPLIETCSLLLSGCGLYYIRGGQTTARGQKSARQDIFNCPFNFFENAIC